ncbi:hypothetical protein FQZ97_934320 [compost metagenome]
MVIKKSKAFEDIVRKVFSHLLETFPVPAHLDASVAGYEVAGTRTVEEGGFSEVVDCAPSNDELLFAHSVRWLAAEGYVRINQEYYTSFQGVTLTARGLELLGATPPCMGRAFYS